MNLFEPNNKQQFEPTGPSVQAQSEPGSGLVAEPSTGTGKPSSTNQPTDQQPTEQPSFTPNIWMLLGAGIAAYLIFSKKRK